MNPDHDGAVPSRSYYGLPVVKEPAWTVEVPWYFWSGGVAGAAAVLAEGAQRAGNPTLAAAARRLAAAGAAVSPPLLISDLGRPERFLAMLRVLKVTSPLSVGSWLLTSFSSAAVGSAVLAGAGRLPRLQRLAQGGAALAGPAMTTYTAALVADTAIPVWHEARRHLPFVFAASSVASAGAGAAVLAGGPAGRPAVRLAAAGSALELAATELMEHRLGPLAAPYHEGKPGRYAKAAKALTAVGGALLATSGTARRRVLVGAVLVAGGSLCQRFAVFHAGFASARRPEDTVGPQRDRRGG